MTDASLRLVCCNGWRRYRGLGLRRSSVVGKRVSRQEIDYKERGIQRGGHDD